MSERIRKFRRKYKVTQEKFAELVGTTRTTVATWEQERFTPNQKAVLERIEEVLRGGNPFRRKKVK